MVVNLGIRGFIVSLACFALLLSASASASTCGGFKKALDVVTLNSNVNADGNTTCFEMTKTWQTLDCAGYTVYSTTGAPDGVKITSKNALVVNCIFATLKTGVLVQSNPNSLNVIRDSTMRNSTTGVSIYGGSFNTLSNVNSSYNRYGVNVTQGSDTNTIYRGYFGSNSEQGVYVNGVNQLNVSYNTFEGGKKGVTATFTSNSLVQGNLFHGLTARAVQFSGENGDNNKVYGNMMYACQNGVLLNSADYNNISYNNISYGYNNGIEVGSASKNNIVSRNTMAYGWYGLLIHDVSSGAPTTGNTISFNNFVGNEHLDVVVWLSSSNNFSYNNLLNGYAGFWVTEASTNNLFRNNTITSARGFDFGAAASGNSVYANVLTNPTGFYVNNSNAGNTFSTAVGGVAQGNYYSDILDWAIYDSNADGFGDSGADYPYDAGETHWFGYGSDSGPITSKTAGTLKAAGTSIFNPK